MRYLVFFLLLLFSFSSSAQFDKWKRKINKTLDDVNEGITTGQRVAYTAQHALYLIEASKRTTKQFNETVRVSRGDAAPAEQKRLEGLRVKNGKIKELNWEPVVYHGEDIFPSAILGLAAYQGKRSSELRAISHPVGFRIVSTRQNVAIRWELISVDQQFFDRVSGVLDYRQAGQEVYVMPEIPWNFAKLARNASPTPVSLLFRIYDESGKFVELNKTVAVRSVNDCLFRYDGTDLGLLFTAYVQESHPEIDQILAEALTAGYTNSFAGYQGDEQSVLRQVAAVYHALHERGIKYSSGTTPSKTNNPKVSSQQVRTFANAIKYRQANCVDGTVVFASILRRIGISAGFVLVPGHCFLVFSADAEGKDLRFLETTLLSNASFLAKTSLSNPESYRKAMVQQVGLALSVGHQAFDKAARTNQANVVGLAKSR
ncbi:MAG: hypothetical protein AAFN92_18330, partial [Bacteroidota bacterium]